MKKVFVVLGMAAVAVSALSPMAQAARPPARTFVAVMTAAQEVPTCTAATDAARGVAVFHVVDEATGTVDYKLIANNLPGDIIAAHIHVAPKGTPGPVVQPLPPTPGDENGVIAQGTFVNADLVSAIQADPDGYYVNVHTDVCQPGVIRGQLGDHGPLNQ
ncbi:MAG TPA: CHRD domain-containing protein [Acidimicrobiales bacterium]|jgi:Cu/Zn superoxide dismutase|nr:CHRD domain-containing protein [Acidimicrobiales bacterium]